MRELLVGLLLWLNANGFPSCVGQPGIQRGSDRQAHGYVAWYQDGIIELSDRFDFAGLFLAPTEQRAKLARSALLHELTHFCQAQREGLQRSQSEVAWRRR